MTATDKLKVVRYRVRRWTAFEFSGALSREEREDHLESIAALIERKLIDMVPKMEPRCVRTRLEGVPQLLFELTVEAADEDDARRRAMYRIDRALQTKVSQGGRRVRLEPPWGKIEVCDTAKIAHLKVVSSPSDADEELED